MLDNYSGEEMGEYSAAVNGWAFWRVLRNNRWVKLEEIRAKHLKLTDYKPWDPKGYPEI